MDEIVIDLLKKVDGISVEDGLLYCGSTAAFVKFINSFYDSIEKKAADIETAYEEEDFTLYTTKVHSLKSTARIIGATELSDFALKLEEAGISGDISFIREKNQEFLDLFKSYLEKLSVLEAAKREDEAAEPIPEDVLKDAYKALKENISMRDYDAVELILSEVKKFKLPMGDRDVLSKLERLHRNMEWEEMEKLV